MNDTVMTDEQRIALQMVRRPTNHTDQLREARRFGLWTEVLAKRRAQAYQQHSTSKLGAALLLLGAALVGGLLIGAMVALMGAL